MDKRNAGRVRLLPWVVAGTVATTVLGGMLFLYFAWTQTDEPFLSRWFDKPTGDHWFNAARTSVALMGVVGIGGAAFLAYRKQRSTEESHAAEETRDLRARYTTAASQLGDESAAVRLAGVYAMAALADDWYQSGDTPQRQVCVDVLCAYLRMPYTPDLATIPQSKKVAASRGEREVRQTIVSVINSHLQGDGWSTCDFDFTAAHFEDAVFTGASFSGTNTRFYRATFSGRKTRFDGAKFMKIDFGEVTFDATNTGFNGARFSGGATRFDGAAFGGEETRFDGVTFGGEVNFDKATFSGLNTRFGTATFSGRDIHFDDATFSGEVNFDKATFSGLNTRFDKATFSGERVSFESPKKWDPPPRFAWDETGVPPPNVFPRDWPPVIMPASSSSPSES